MATSKAVVRKPAAAARPKAPKGGKAAALRLAAVKPAAVKVPAAGRQTKASPAKIQIPALREMVVHSTPGLARANGRKPLPPSKNAARRGPERYDPDALIHGIKPYQPRPGEAYMNPAQLDHFRAILKAWRRELMEEVDRTVHHMQDEASNFPDPNDRATQESEFGLELRTRDRERKLLKKIDQALERIGDRAYGYCEETGEEIGLKRLEARPVATLSLEAQERREMAERQYGERDDHYR
jgi:DnaK suppressor protein